MLMTEQMLQSNHNKTFTYWDLEALNVFQFLLEGLLQAIKCCISACYSAILWELLQLENGSGRGTSAAQQQKQLRDHLEQYIPLMNEIVVTSNVALYREEVQLLSAS